MPSLISARLGTVIVKSAHWGMWLRDGDTRLERRRWERRNDQRLMILVRGCWTLVLGFWPDESAVESPESRVENDKRDKKGLRSMFNVLRETNGNY